MNTYRLEPITVHARPLAFTWNPEAGTFAGPDGDYVGELADQYARLGTVTSNPYPTSYPCTDPRHNPAHLAAILSTRWRLPAELIRHLPPPRPPPKGTVPVVY